MKSRSLRETVSSLRGILKAHNINAVETLSDRFLASKILSTGLSLIVKETSKRKLWNSPNIFTSLPCLQLIQVPLADCCDYTSECTIARSKCRLPKIAEGSAFGMLIQGLFSIDGKSRKFIESTANRYANSLGLNLKTKEIQYWLIDKYLYIGDQNIEEVKMSAYFAEDIPQELLECGKKKKGCCPKNPMDEELKIPEYLITPTLQMLEKEFLETYEKIPTQPTTGIPEKKA